VNEFYNEKEPKETNVSIDTSWKKAFRAHFSLRGYRPEETILERTKRADRIAELLETPYLKSKNSDRTNMER